MWVGVEEGDRGYIDREEIEGRVVGVVVMEEGVCGWKE